MIPKNLKMNFTIVEILSVYFSMLNYNIIMPIRSRKRPRTMRSRRSRKNRAKSPKYRRRQSRRTRKRSPKRRRLSGGSTHSKKPRKGSNRGGTQHTWDYEILCNVLDEKYGLSWRSLRPGTNPRYAKERIPQNDYPDILGQYIGLYKIKHPKVVTSGQKMVLKHVLTRLRKVVNGIVTTRRYKPGQGIANVINLGEAERFGVKGLLNSQMASDDAFLRPEGLGSAHTPETKLPEVLTHEEIIGELQESDEELQELDRQDSEIGVLGGLGEGDEMEEGGDLDSVMEMAGAE